MWEIAPLIVLNKVDMLDDAARARIEHQLETYRKLGYEVLLVSCESGEGIDALRRRSPTRSASSWASPGWASRPSPTP